MRTHFSCQNILIRNIQYTWINKFIHTHLYGDIVSFDEYNKECKEL